MGYYYFVYIILPLDSIQYLTFNSLVSGERNLQPFVIATITLSLFILVLIVVIGLLKWQQRQKVRAERRNAEARLQRPRHADTAILSPEYAQPTEEQGDNEALMASHFLLTSFN